MNAADELYSIGISLYSEAIFAVGCFEMIIVEETERIVENKMDEIAHLFGVEKLHGGGGFRARPEIDQIRDLTISTLWAWVGREYLIPSLSNCFFGLIIVNGKSFVGFMFRKNDRNFREKIHKILSAANLEYYYDQDSGETVVCRALEGSAAVSDFGKKLASLIDALIAALAKEASFVTSVGSEGTT